MNAIEVSLYERFIIFSLDFRSRRPFERVINLPLDPLPAFQEVYLLNILGFRNSVLEKENTIFLREAPEVVLHSDKCGA